MSNVLSNIPVVILCGGKGSRLLEETSLTPKPLINLDKFSLLFHIMRIYLKSGFKNFIILTGYKHLNFVKYFKNKLPRLLNEKIIISKENGITFLYKNFSIKIINTGNNTLTGARILKVKELLKKKDYFAVTYGDGLSNVNIKKTFIKLKKSKNHGIMSVVNPIERFGKVKIKNNLVTKFNEKKIDHNKWINIGFFIFKNNFFRYLDNKSMLENKPLKKVTQKRKLMVHKHKGFYHCIDFLNEKKIAQNLIKKFKIPPWLR